MKLQIQSIVAGDRRSDEQTYRARLLIDDEPHEFSLTVSDSGVEADEAFKRMFAHSPAELKQVYDALSKATRRRTTRESRLECPPLLDAHEEPIEKPKPFDVFHREMQGTLMDFLTQCGFDQASVVLTRAILFLPALDGLLRDVAIEDEASHAFFRFGVAAFMGEYFVQKYGGQWRMVEEPSMSKAGRYEVSQFKAPADEKAAFDPLDKADEFLKMPTPREFAEFLAIIDTQISE